MSRESSDSEETSRKQGVEDPDHRSGHEYEQFVDFFENSPVPMHWVGPDGTVIHANQAELDALGYSREEYVGSHIADFHADQDVIDDILDRLRSDEELNDYEARMERKDGSIRHVLIDSCVNREDGEFVNTRCVTHDITERKEHERELEEIYGRISDAFYALDENWEFTHLNEQAHDVINPDGRELEGKNVWDEFPAATERKFKPKFEQAMYEQETVSFEEYYPEPLNAWFEVRAYPSETGLSVYFRDITDRKERERQLRESEQRYRTLAQSFPNGIVTLFDEELRYTLASGRAFEYLPVAAADVEGSTPREVWGDVGRDVLEPAFEAVLDGQERSVEVEYSGWYWVIHAVPITDESGNVLSGMTIAQDITERKHREEEIADREQAPSVFS
ncbi:PAS domain S-box-containing protein [Halorubrum aquaticum]|uniref:PAS domain S-box-containing protein n=1 Tax=Halorubrum aquaticum TaxID=387340 RepID=A0A1I3AJ62_9EURY|nr:PAS domain-containing protein [Halorubrum aquaticum]SFH50065.1 PAS domain S-box-containing protein [Halorubrum aquaticum]